MAEAHKRAFNFAAGPATLPAEVVPQIREQLPDWRGTGASVIEASHRSEAFLALASNAEGALRNLLAVPEASEVLFLQGGATASLYNAMPLEDVNARVGLMENFGRRYG